MIYIATFFSHFGAVRFARLWEKCGGQAKLMPVPRRLSSSCGTCVEYVADTIWPEGAVTDEVEQIVAVLGEDFESLYKAEGV